MYAAKVYCNIRVSCYCMLPKFIAIYESHVSVCCQSFCMLTSRVSYYCMLSKFITIYESLVTVCCQSLLRYTTLMLLYALKVYSNIRVSCYYMLSKFIYCML